MTLSAAATSEVTVQYRLLSGTTAQEGDDAYFPSSARSVTFAARRDLEDRQRGVNGDFVAEPDEAVVLEVFSASGGRRWRVMRRRLGDRLDPRRRWQWQQWRCSPAAGGGRGRFGVKRPTSK